jgi:hypothetical protein
LDELARRSVSAEQRNCASLLWACLSMLIQA